MFETKIDCGPPSVQEIACQKGEDHRTYKGWYASGSVCRKSLYLKGKRQGTSYGYYESGNLWYEDHYRDNQQHGTSIEYYESGQRKCICNYQNGQRHGVAKGWYKSGEWSFTYLYLHGNEVTEEEFIEAEGSDKVPGEGMVVDVGGIKYKLVAI